MWTRFKRITTLITAFAPIAAAGTLVGYSPISCGCIDPWVSLALGLDLPTDNWATLTPRNVQVAFERKYSGKSVSIDDLPFADEIDECAIARPNLLRCTYWLWQNGSEKKGLEVTLVVGEKGAFKSAQVLEVDARS